MAPAGFIRRTSRRLARKDREMSKLLDLLERIRDGSPAPLGFGAARAETLPGMALLGRASRATRPSRSRRPRGLSRAAAASLDAAIVDRGGSADYLAEMGNLLADLPWGPALTALAAADTAALGESGADLVAVTLEGAAAALTGEENLARLLVADPEWDDRELRAVVALPVDALIVDLTAVAGPWTLADLVKVGVLSRRADKYILVEIAQAPAAKDLESLRDMGVNGLIASLETMDAAALAALKADLRAMPRPRPRRRERRAAAIPGAAFAQAAPHPSRDPEPDDGDEDF